ncbi:leucine-rich repeat domain-containing protein [Mycoplasma phocoenae]|uniref:Leucine-rich repeat domain-containing protein n=1 Tax=Mycoplasma phocoenae TaxID=754517 RepID=A0A858U7T6_9MOLU|nr:leucine-rich repeat domain-containing protein [Mycoplasma phocoenae]QJG66838.1 leucine-rich repeat domain-containing protein [Mycoplasma phocoenae]
MSKFKKIQSLLISLPVLLLPTSVISCTTENKRNDPTEDTNVIETPSKETPDMYIDLNNIIYVTINEENVNKYFELDESNAKTQKPLILKVKDEFKKITALKWELNWIPKVNEEIYIFDKIERLFLSNITEIGNDSFINKTNLISVNLPNVTTIGDSAFQDTTKLDFIDLPNVTSIGKEAFEFENNTEGVINGIFVDGTNAYGDIILPNVTKVVDSAFQNNTNINSIALPNVDEIGDAAFAGVTSLESITLPT